MLAYDYPLLGAFWTLLWIFLWVVWIFILFRIILDIFRSHDMNGWIKALWLIFLLFIPFLSALIYLIVRGRGMTERDISDAQARDAAFRDYVQSAATTSGGGAADEIAKLADLRDKGVITPAEFEQQKAKILA
jgi:hypothetical protein